MMVSDEKSNHIILHMFIAIIILLISCTEHKEIQVWSKSEILVHIQLPEELMGPAPLIHLLCCWLLRGVLSHIGHYFQVVTKWRPDYNNHFQFLIYPVKQTRCFFVAIVSVCLRNDEKTSRIILGA